MDPLSVHTHYNTLLATAQSNSSVYNALDGPQAFDLCSTLFHFQSGLNEARFLQANDPNVRMLLDSIRGQLVMYPLNFLQSENLGPSVATKAVVSNDLWV